MDLYPDAKIILNQRKTAEAWYKSIHDALDFFSVSLTVTKLVEQFDRP